MKVGDLVKNINSDSGLLWDGVIVDWVPSAVVERKPLVRWQDGRTYPTLPHMVEVVNENR